VVTGLPAVIVIGVYCAARDDLLFIGLSYQAVRWRLKRVFLECTVMFQEFVRGLD